MKLFLLISFLLCSAACSKKSSETAADCNTATKKVDVANLKLDDTDEGCTLEKPEEFNPETQSKNP